MSHIESLSGDHRSSFPPDIMKRAEKCGGLEQDEGKLVREEKEPFSAVRQIAFHDTHESLAPGE